MDPCSSYCHDTCPLTIEHRYCAVISLYLQRCSKHITSCPIIQRRWKKEHSQHPSRRSIINTTRISRFSKCFDHHGYIPQPFSQIITSFHLRPPICLPRHLPQPPPEEQNLPSQKAQSATHLFPNKIWSSASKSEFWTSPFTISSQLQRDCAASLFRPFLLNLVLPALHLLTHGTTAILTPTKMICLI